MNDVPSRILVVDDNRINRLKLTMTLQQQGYAVDTAEDGQQALAMLEAGSFDAVLLDLVMPGIDGYQVLERIKSNPALRDIPVIVISALDEIESAVRCIEMGAEDYLPKSFDPVLLRARLSSSLQKKKLRDLEKMYVQQEVMLRQSEKLATLGRLSAGLAHELNNPAGAAQQAAAQLQAAFSGLQETQLRLSTLNLSDKQAQTLLALDKLAQKRAKQPIYLDPLQRSDLESDIESWLAAHGFDKPWEIAPALVNLGYGPDEMQELLPNFPSEIFAIAIDWLNCSSTVYSLTEEIMQGTARISEIVKALRAYSYADQAPIQSVDVHEGLDNTLIMLRSKLQPGIMVHRHYAPNLPRIDAYGSQLNQVWTNIIDNAIDAMKGKGDISIRTRRDKQWVMVEIEDNGPGIPEAIQANIFDPFFTTKAPGQGTGLGLNISYNIIVQKHHGEIALHSQPGRTVFDVRLPLHVRHSDD